MQLAIPDTSDGEPTPDQAKPFDGLNERIPVVLCVAVSVSATFEPGHLRRRVKAFALQQEHRRPSDSLNGFFALAATWWKVRQSPQ